MAPSPSTEQVLELHNELKKTAKMLRQMGDDYEGDAKKCDMCASEMHDVYEKGLEDPGYALRWPELFRYHNAERLNMQCREMAGEQMVQDQV